MKKSYTITCHNVYNYGASLQAYALQQYLLSRGLDNEIINYMPNYLNWHYHLKWWVSKRSSYYKITHKNPLFHLLYVLVRFISDLRTLPRKRNFDKFTLGHLSLTSRCESILEIEPITQDAHLLFAGSDQIWNSYNLENGLDEAFYLAFGNNKAKRISYAASFGADEIKQGLEDFVYNRLKKFNAISVRERSGVDIVSKLGLSSEVVLDPVFLLSIDHWHRMVNKNVEGDYILVYNLGEKSDNIRECVEHLHRITNLKIISVFGKVHLDWCKEVTDAGPIEFLTLIYNSKYVVTNSFHCTAFSLIFEKEFYCYSYNKSKASTRIEELLKNVYLLERYNTPKEEINSSRIQYSIVKDIVRDKINISKKWLDTAIEYDC